MISAEVPASDQPEIFPDPVADDDGVVQGVADHCQHRGEHRQIERPLHQREHPQRDDHVMDQGDDRTCRELLGEAEQNIEHDHDEGRENRQTGILEELVADRGTHVVGLTHLHFGVAILQSAQISDHRAAPDRCPTGAACG